MGSDSRFVVTNQQGRTVRAIHDDIYCRRGQAENHIKSWKTYLAADRTSCSSATAALPARWRLLADVVAARSCAEAVHLACRPIRHPAPQAHQDHRQGCRDEDPDKIHLPSAAPFQEILSFIFGRLPRLVTCTPGQCAPYLNPSSSTRQTNSPESCRKRPAAEAHVKTQPDREHSLRPRRTTDIMNDAG